MVNHNYTGRDNIPRSKLMEQLLNSAIMKNITYDVWEPYRRQEVINDWEWIPVNNSVDFSISYTGTRR